MTRADPVTPGELLKAEFLLPMKISQYRLAKEIGVPAQRISAIVHGMRSISADTDLRLCRFFGLSNGYWLRAQALHDIEVAGAVLEKALRKNHALADEAVTIRLAVAVSSLQVLATRSCTRALAWESKIGAGSRSMRV